MENSVIPGHPLDGNPHPVVLFYVVLGTLLFRVFPVKQREKAANYLIDWLVMSWISGNNLQNIGVSLWIPFLAGPFWLVKADNDDPDTTVNGPESHRFSRNGNPLFLVIPGLIGCPSKRVFS